MQSEPIAKWKSARFLPLPICSAPFFYLTTVVRNFQPPLRRVPRWQDMTYEFCQINYLPCISRRATIHWQQHGQTHRLDAGDAREQPTLLGLRRVSSTARLLGLLVRIPPGAWMSLVSVACCQVEVSAVGWSFVQRLPPSMCVVLLCDEMQQ